MYFKKLGPMILRSFKKQLHKVKEPKCGEKQDRWEEKSHYSCLAFLGMKLVEARKDLKDQSRLLAHGQVGNCAIDEKYNSQIVLMLFIFKIQVKFVKVDMVAKNEKSDKCFSFDVLTPNDLLHLRK